MSIIDSHCYGYTDAHKLFLRRAMLQDRILIQNDTTASYHTANKMHVLVTSRFQPEVEGIVRTNKQKLKRSQK